MPGLATLAPEMVPPTQGFTARGPRRGQPVLLATLSVRIDPEAERLAVESALEADVALVVANVVWPPPLSTYVIRLQAHIQAVRETAARASARGIPTEFVLRVPGFRPTRALLALARERDVGLVVLGPDPRYVNQRDLRRAAQAVYADLDCLVWNGSGP